MSDYIVAIPSRLASTRLPNKPLVPICGIPMIRRVCMQALKSKAQRVIACVDSDKIAACLTDLPGTEVCMTSPQAACGTDRIAQMIESMHLDLETIIVNIQGDEPLISPEHIEAVAQLLVEKQADMATLCFRIDNEHDVFDPSCVKVVFDGNGMALYFSRAPIPYERDNFMHHQAPTATHYHHIGIYAYKAGTVLRYNQLSRPEIEVSESLEQLRLLHHGMKIAVGVTENPPETGVDTPEDLERVCRYLKAHGEA